MTDPIATPSDADAEKFLVARRLVATTRRLMRAVATTDVEPSEMAEAERVLAGVTERLTRRALGRHRRVPFGPDGIARARAGEPWEHFAYNPQGIPFELHLDGPRASATLELTELHEGPPGLLHGGFSAALMDALLGSLVQAEVGHSVTASLELRYRHPVPLGGVAELGAEVVEVSGRKTWAEAWLAVDGVRAVTARGLFVAIPTGPAASSAPRR